MTNESRERKGGPPDSVPGSIDDERGPLKSWEQWLSLWKGSRFLQERLGLLHCALDFEERSNDCAEAVRFVFGLLMVKPRKTRFHSPYWQRIQDKAEAVLLQGFFKKAGSDAPRGIVIIGEHPDLVPIVFDAMIESVLANSTDMAGHWCFTPYWQGSKAEYVKCFLDYCTQWLFHTDGWPGQALRPAPSLTAVKKQLFRLFIRYGMYCYCQRDLQPKSVDEVPELLAAARDDLGVLADIAAGDAPHFTLGKALLLPRVNEEGSEMHDAAAEHALLKARIAAFVSQHRLEQADT